MRVFRILVIWETRTFQDKIELDMPIQFIVCSYLLIVPFHMRSQIGGRHEVSITDWTFVIQDSYSTAIMTSKLNLACEMFETKLFWMILKVNRENPHMHKNVQVISGFWIHGWPLIGQSRCIHWIVYIEYPPVSPTQNASHLV